MWHVWNRSECIQGFVGGNLIVRGHLEVSLLDLTEIGTDGMDWIILAQDIVKWRAPVNVSLTI
jgi:hypothetical protein